MQHYSLNDINKHKERKSLWIVRHGKVYDVTEFAEKHPGGLDVMLDAGGTDATHIMKSAHMHSKFAYKMMDTFCIGKVMATKNVKKRKKGQQCVHTESSEPNANQLTTNKGWKEDELINWEEPIFFQVGKLGRHYLEWVHSPVDRSIRIFKSDILEKMSICPWWVIPLIYLPLSLVSLILAYRNFLTQPRWPWLTHLYGGGVEISIQWIPVLFIAGLFMWTISEYVMHRWVFHLRPPASSPFLMTLHFFIHGIHHKAPMDKRRLVFPPALGLIVTSFFILLYMCIFPKVVAQVVVSSFMLGYIAYDLTHYYLHFGAPRSAYLKDLKHYHMNHHYLHQDKGFGVSSKFWDFPFGTLMPNSKPN